jgi:hypothetical protein
MPHIYDNVEAHLLAALKQMLVYAHRADFCVGYLNLRGWRLLDDAIGQWPGGAGHQCRVLVGMQRTPQDDLRALFGANNRPDILDNSQVNRARRRDGRVTTGNSASPRELRT